MENENYRVYTPQFDLGGFYKRPFMVVIYIILAIVAIASYIMSDFQGLSLVLIVYLAILGPILLIAIIASEIRAKMLEFRKDGIAVYKYNMKFERFILWTDVIRVEPVHGRGGDFISIKCSDGRKYVIYESQDTIEVLIEKGKVDSMESFLANRKNNRDRYTILLLIMFFVFAGIVLIYRYL